MNILPGYLYFVSYMVWATTVLPALYNVSKASFSFVSEPVQVCVRGHSQGVRGGAGETAQACAAQVWLTGASFPHHRHPQPFTQASPEPAPRTDVQRLETVFNRQAPFLFFIFSIWLYPSGWLLDGFSKPWAHQAIENQLFIQITSASPFIGSFFPFFLLLEKSETILLLLRGTFFPIVHSECEVYSRTSCLFGTAHFFKAPQGTNTKSNGEKKKRQKKKQPLEPGIYIGHDKQALLHFTLAKGTIRRDWRRGGKT